MVLLGPYHLRAHPGNLEYYYSPSRCIESRDRQMLVSREPFGHCSYPYGEAFQQVSSGCRLEQMRIALDIIVQLLLTEAAFKKRPGSADCSAGSEES